MDHVLRSDQPQLIPPSPRIGLPVVSACIDQVIVTVILTPIVECGGIGDALFIEVLLRNVKGVSSGPFQPMRASFERVEIRSLHIVFIRCQVVVKIIRGQHVPFTVCVKEFVVFMEEAVVFGIIH